MTEGRIGEWTVVPVQLPPASSSTSSAEPTPDATSAYTTVHALHGGDDGDIHGWKFKRRRVAVGLDDIYDPGIIEVRKKEEETTPPPPPEPKAEEDPAGSGATELPKWTPRGWLKPNEAPPRAIPPEGDTAPNEQDKEMPIKKEEESAPLPGEPSQKPNAEPLPPAMKVEEPQVPKVASAPEPSSTGLFRKRKVPASGAGTRGSRW